MRCFAFLREEVNLANVMDSTINRQEDGIVDRYVNRKFSGILTPFFIKLGISPNAITIISMLIGLGGAACFAVGSYKSVSYTHLTMTTNREV